MQLTVQIVSATEKSAFVGYNRNIYCIDALNGAWSCSITDTLLLRLSHCSIKLPLDMIVWNLGSGSKLQGQAVCLLVIVTKSV